MLRALLRSGASVHTLQHGCASVRAAHTLCGSPLLDEAHAAIKQLAASGGGAPCRVDACSVSVAEAYPTMHGLVSPVDEAPHHPPGGDAGAERCKSQ